MRAKRERARKSPHARKGDTRRGERVSPFLAWGDFHARSRFARSTIPEEKWGTTRSLRIIRLEGTFAVGRQTRVTPDCLMPQSINQTTSFTNMRPRVILLD